VTAGNVQAAPAAFRSVAPAGAESDGSVSGLAVKPISLDLGPTIDWTGQLGDGAAKRKKEAVEPDSGDKKGAWRRDFVGALGQTESDRNPNSRMRVTGVTDKDLGKPLYRLTKTSSR
jgi:hypothetical protein